MKLQHDLYFLFMFPSQIKCVQKLRFHLYIHYLNFTNYKIFCLKVISLFNLESCIIRTILYQHN